MRSSALGYITAADFRAGLGYELVPLDRLSPQQRAALGEIDFEADVYGVLFPRDPARTLSVKTVDRETALLYLTLQRPGKLPTYMRSVLGDQFVQTVTQLVLNGIIEISHDGTFVSGPHAAELLSPVADMTATVGRLAGLSIEALKYAQHLEVVDTATLALSIYEYNRYPLTPAWARRLPTRAAVARHLGLEDAATARGTLGRGWIRQPTAAGDRHWLTWTQSEGRTVPRNGGTVPTTSYKLYVSPAPAQVADVLRCVADVCRSVHAPAFKVGADIHGLLRPDKLVAYFASFEQLGDAAARLRERLEGVPAHGVPFTAEVTKDGVLSWGADPPRHAQSALWAGESWRLWLAGRLAAGILAAREAPASTTEPWQFALKRISLEGVDARSWVPSQTIWSDMAER